MKKVLAAIILSISCLCHAKLDSMYIKPFEYKLAIRPYIGYNFLIINQNEIENNKSRTFTPNIPPTIGAGFSLNNTIISLSYGYGFDFMKGKEYGKTEAFDFQYHNYMQKFVFDIFLQRYKGFYESEYEKRKEVIDIYTDMSVEQYGAYGQYIFNNKKYSYRAAFNKNEKQIVSCGSFLIGMGVSDTKIRMGESWDNAKYDSFQIGVNGGYAYTWVINQNWDINGSISAGINAGSKSIKDFGKSMKIYPTAIPRFSVGYDKKDWTIGMSYVGNMVFPSLSEKMNVSVHSGSAQIFFMKRFVLIPFLDK